MFQIPVETMSDEEEVIVGDGHCPRCNKPLSKGAEDDNWILSFCQECYRVYCTEKEW